MLETVSRMFHPLFHLNFRTVPDGEKLSAISASKFESIQGSLHGRSEASHESKPSS